MDSHVLKSYKSKLKTPHENEIAEKRYISTVYFHTLFLFTITKKQNIYMKKGNEDIDVADYIKELFSSYYSEFLLNFGMSELMESLTP